MAGVGIFAGTFDPVHNGHVAFALAALEAGGLDAVAFMPEPNPRRKTKVTSLEHRVAMLRLVAASQPRFEVLLLPDEQFSVAATLPKLQRRYPGSELTLLIGSDIAATVSSWAEADALYAAMNIMVGLRAGQPRPVLTVPVTCVPTMQAAVAASNIRSGQSQDVAPEVRAYIQKYHLYGV